MPQSEVTKYGQLCQKWLNQFNYVYSHSSCIVDQQIHSENTIILIAISLINWNISSRLNINMWFTGKFHKYMNFTADVLFWLVLYSKVLKFGLHYNIFSVNKFSSMIYYKIISESSRLCTSNIDFLKTQCIFLYSYKLKCHWHRIIILRLASAVWTSAINLFTFNLRKPIILFTSLVNTTPQNK